MPVMKNVLDSKVKMTYDYGVDENGKAVTKSKTLANIKAAATDQDIFDVVTGLAGLQEVPLTTVIREDDATLSQA